MDSSEYARQRKSEANRAYHLRTKIAKLQLSEAVLAAQQQIDEERLMRATLAEESAALGVLLDYQTDVEKVLQQGLAATPALQIRWRGGRYQQHGPQPATAAAPSAVLKALEVPDKEQPQQQQRERAQRAQPPTQQQQQAQQQQRDDGHQTVPPSAGTSALSIPDANDANALAHVFANLGWSEPEIRSLETTLPTFRCNAVDVAPWQLRLLAKALAVMPPRLAQVPTSLVEQRNAAFIRVVRHAVEQWLACPSLRPSIDEMLTMRIQNRVTMARLMAETRPSAVLDVLRRVSPPHWQEAGARGGNAQPPLHSPLAKVVGELEAELSPQQLETLTRHWHRYLERVGQERLRHLELAQNVHSAAWVHGGAFLMMPDKVAAARSAEQLNASLASFNTSCTAEIHALLDLHCALTLEVLAPIQAARLIVASAPKLVDPAQLCCWLCGVPDNDSSAAAACSAESGAGASAAAAPRSCNIEDGARGFGGSLAPPAWRRTGGPGGEGRSPQGSGTAAASRGGTRAAEESFLQSCWAEEEDSEGAGSAPACCPPGGSGDGACGGAGDEGHLLAARP